MAAYQFNFTNAQEGMIADSSLKRVDSSVAIAAGNVIEFGKAVSAGTFGSTFELVAVPYDNTREIFGVTVYTPVNFDGIYHNTDRCSILSFGRIWVKVEYQCYAGYPAYVDNNPINMGKFTIFSTYSSNPGENNRRVGTFLSHAPDGGLAVLDFAPWLN